MLTSNIIPHACAATSAVSTVEETVRPSALPHPLTHGTAPYLQVLKNQTIQNNDGVMSFNGQTVTMQELITKVTEVYVQCGFDRDNSVGILQMLTNIEVRLDEYLHQVSRMPEEFVESMEKAREKERRTAAREQKIATNKREQEARLRRALERAQAPIHKKTGKMLMPRSQPIRKKKVQEEHKLNDEEVELQAFLARPDL